MGISKAAIDNIGALRGVRCLVYKKTNHYYKAKLAKLDVANPLKKANAAQPAGSHAPELEATTRADTTATDGASAVHGDTVAGMGE
ncbi:hypothetical protein VTO73DRAFT_10266 [Trametes versicolor]